jgi:uncharacterized protein YlaI
MTARVTTTPRGLVRFGVVLLASALVWAFGVSTAFAADTTPTPVQQLQRGPLLAFTCTECHASLATTTTVSAVKGVKFSHGSHMTYDCTACHPRFPHTKTGTVRPLMNSCFSCHGLRHGSQGIIAGGECVKCHIPPRAQIVLPLDHQDPNYKGKGHVAPANATLRTSCMMCHTQAQCDACHFQTKVSWTTTQSFTYDPGNSCLACHKSDLPRIAAPVTASALDSSAHGTLTCGQCHPDFQYVDAKSATPLWNVNAGLACGTKGCHDKEQAVWAASVHGTAVLTGKDLTAATCGGCHSGHNIERLKTDAAKLRLRLAGEQMCVAGCHTHEAAYASYSDWWHGAAYKAGSADAPACWTCHGAHQTVALKDPASMTSPEKLPSTCGQTGCHQGATETFVETWRTLAHGRGALTAANPIVAFRTKLFGTGR